tara:strand:+ start:901 stop:1152 length:252 start_codon:yes stop_codon:yes gene_type:complete
MSGNTGGNIHKKTRAWNELGDFFTKAGAERAMDIMMASEDVDFMKYYDNLLEYFQPKLARSENVNKNENKIEGVTVQIIDTKK